jgi:glycosyltransferase involved in cell wall biosynthesis
MKRLTLLHTEWSKGWGGQEIRVLNEALGMQARGHRVLIATRPHCQLLARARDAGLPTVMLPMRGAFDLRSIAGLARVLRREHVDLVNTHSSIDSWIGGFAAKLTRTRLVRTRHLSTPWRRHPLNFVVHMPDAVITTGEALRRELMAVHGFRPDRVLSVPTGIDVDAFIPASCAAADRAALGIPPGAIALGNVAVLRNFKRHDLLIDAAAQLRARHDCYVAIAGAGPTAAIAAHARTRGFADRVRFLGHLEDVRPLLRCADVVVSASGSHEGVPQALIQALAMARPVVATAVGAVGELVQHERTGLLVPPGDAGALAAAVERLLLDPALAADCGRRGRTHVAAQYSSRQMIDRLLGLYDQLLPAGARSGS